MSDTPDLQLEELIRILESNMTQKNTHLPPTARK